MEESKNLTGKLLVAQPKFLFKNFEKSVILVAQNNTGGSWGVVVNKWANTISMQDIMRAAGIEYNGIKEVHIGGPIEPTRVHVIHTLDWFSSNTLRVTDEIGITGDISVLAAIAGGQGPKIYKVGVGVATWSAGQLEGEISGLEPWTSGHQWLTTDATIDLVLKGAGEEQWQRAINQCVTQKISDFF